MVEKHHPASSAGARTAATRAMRHKDRIVVSEKTTQPTRSVEATGYARGARIKRKSAQE